MTRGECHSEKLTFSYHSKEPTLSCHSEEPEATKNLQKGLEIPRLRLGMTGENGDSSVRCAPSE